MEATVLKAIERNDKPNKVRRNGFIPGVLNEPDTTSTSVQFEAIELNKAIAKHGTKAKLWIDVNGEKKFGLIKEVQTNPVKGIILHVMIQVVPQDKEVKLQLPIAFHGHQDLMHRMLQVQVLKTEIEVLGKATLMPDVVTVDLSTKELGDTVTAEDFNLDSELKVLDSQEEIYAVIKATREEIVETDEADDTEVSAEDTANTDQQTASKE